MKIRRATREDCPAMLKLIQELAVYEKMPEEVTVDPVHFEESGFGPNPVWWAFVVEKVEEVEKVEVVEGVEVVEEGKVEHVEEVEKVEESTSLNLPKPSKPPKPIVAFALYYIRYSTWKGQVMYLEDILVTESKRGRGIGKLLMDRLIEEATEKGFKKITWQVLDWNQPAIDFYKKYDVQFDPTWINVALDI